MRRGGTAILGHGGSLLLFTGFDPLQIVLWTLAFIVAVSVHEANHAFVATALGDDTPRRAGRLSLNPMRHVDRIGLLTFVLAGFGWGWTPVNPSNLRPNPRLGNAVVAAAGPVANLGMALLFTLLLRVGLGFPPVVNQFLAIAAMLNLLLFVFNLFPIPPLDGFTVLLGMVPRNVAESLRGLERYGLGLLFALLILPQLLGFDIVGRLLGFFARILGLR
jgi:Zn-dependent protease